MMHNIFVTFGPIGAEWELEGAGDSNTTGQQEPLLHVMGGIQDTSALNETDVFKGQTDRPSEERLMEV